MYLWIAARPSGFLTSRNILLFLDPKDLFNFRSKFRELFLKGKDFFIPPIEAKYFLLYVAIAGRIQHYLRVNNI